MKTLFKVVFGVTYRDRHVKSSGREAPGLEGIVRATGPRKCRRSVSAPSQLRATAPFPRCPERSGMHFLTRVWAILTPHTFAAAQHSPHLCSPISATKTLLGLLYATHHQRLLLCDPSKHSQQYKERMDSNRRLSPIYKCVNFVTPYSAGRTHPHARSARASWPDQRLMLC